MAMIKYLHEVEGESGERISYSRADLDGAPFRSRNGRVPMIRGEEFEELSERVYDVQVKILNLFNEEDLAEYTDILDRIKNNLYELVYRKHGIVAEPDRYLVLIEYAKKFREIPAAGGYRSDVTNLSPTRMAMR